MKTIKCTFTLVLTLAVLLAGFSFPAFQGEAYAETRTSSGIAGTNDVGIVPDELLQSGEWLYYLDGDEAIIAGYANKKESSLTIPYKLSKHLVTGISSGAFFENTKLTNVTIHSLITRIGEGVFNNSGINIQAYSGAYALEYSQYHSLKLTNLSNPVGLFDVTCNVIDPNGFPNNSMIETSSGSITITKEVSNVITIGNYILSRSKSTDENLIVYQVKGKTHNGDFDVLSVDLASNIDVLIDQMRISADQFYVDPEWLNAYNRQVSGDTVNSALFPLIPIPARTINDSITLPVNYNFTSWLSVSGSITIKPKGVISALIVHPAPGIFLVKDAVVDVDVTHTESLTVTATAKDKSDLFEYELPIKPQFRAGPVALTFSISLGISASGSITVSTEGVYDVRAICSNFVWKNHTEKPISRSNIDGEVKVEIGPTIELAAVLGASVNNVGLEIKLVSAKCKPILEVSAKVSFKTVSGTWCTNLESNIHVEVSVACGILECILGIIKTQPSIGLTWKHKFNNIWENKCHIDHVDAGQPYIRDKCYIDNREVVFVYNNGQNNRRTIADACTKINDPGVPEKNGFVFGGWYFSTVTTSAAGGGRSFDTYRWDFNNFRLPYFPEDGYYRFEAKWLNPGEEPEGFLPTQPGSGEWDHGSIGTGTWHPEPPKPIEVSSVVVNKSDEVLHVDGQYKDKLYLTATVLPANAADTSVTWSSSNESVATVDQDGVVSALTEGETTIICQSNMVPSVTGKCKVTVFQPVYVQSISLDKTSEELWANESEKNSLQLSATVIPANATYTSVHWSSSDENVAWVDGWGKVTGLSAGTATITCTSIKNQDVKATCQITVHQHVRDIYVSSEKDGLLPGETAQLSALCYPTDSDNKHVSWTSSDEAVATVDATGVVTAHSYGEAIITATSADGGSVSGDRSVTVEHELALIGNVQNDELYLDGDNSVVIGYVFATQGSVRRMIERGYDLEWNLLNGETKVADAYYDVVSTTYTVDGQDYDMATAVLYSGELHSAGAATFTLQCKAGPYMATVDLSTTVVGDTLAKTVTLDPSTFDLEMDEVAHIPSAPIATDGGVIPRILSVSMSGNAYYRSHAHESSDDDGLCVWFPESGQYTANVIYKAANITYTVPVTFQVRDEDGMMRLPVTEVALSDSFVNLVVGDTHQLTAEVLPSDAYDRSVTWVSEDESIATVSQDGLVTAKARGMAYIRCEANDGSGCYDSCVINIEPFMALNETSIEKTIYMDGQTHATIDSCSLTYQSAIRIEEQGLTPNWKLQRISGDATEIALNEFTAVADGNVRIEGEEIELLRANHIGVDEYELVCEAGEYSAACSILITVLEAGNLPESIALVTDSYETNMGETLTIDTSVICTPSTVELPGDVNISLNPSKAFWNAMEDGTYFGDFSCTFAEAGEYTADLVYSGANYRYVLPITVRVKDENGDVPIAIQDIVMSEDSVQLFVGESKQLSAAFIPENAPYGELEWSCFDTSIATVSEDGVVTAMDAGITYVIASSPMSDHSAICLITVEDGLTLENDTLTKTIFVDGATRTTLEDVYLTEASSKRLNAAPEWKLQRVSGNNLTLRVKECESANASGDILYGCNILLYSVSAEGQTVYDLVCTSGNESTTIRITVNAVNREGNIPASIALTPTSYEADVDELIVVKPEVTCWPADTQLPVGTRVEYVGNKQFLEAINQEDWFVSQSISTFSFKEAGRYEANCVYSYSNISYTVPITFNIRDDQGEVPVHAVKMKLNTTSLQLVAGEESQLEAVFTPVDVTDSSVTWVSSDPSVATVSAEGHVCALANGSAEITCTPADTHCSAVTCYVTVEDYLTVETGSTSYSCYLEGEQVNDLSSAWLSEGTVMRLNRDGIKPTWKLNTISGDSAVIVGLPEKDGSRILVATTALTSAGSTEYTIQCTAGEQQWSQDYTVTVNEAGVQAPEEVILATPEINLAVGEARTIDFAPVCLPVGTTLPQKTTKAYAGIGGFYEARDRSVYAEDGDNVTVAFTKPGRYLLARLYRARNLNYTALCVINVEAQSDAGFGLLRASETECTVYLDGRSGVVSDISFYDAMVYERYGNELEWTVERLSGDSVSLGLIPNDNSIKLFVADAEKPGTDVWRVSCGFGGITDYIDITVEAKEARKPIPTSIELSTQKITGVIGNWLYLPLGVKCIPDGSALPETGDAFWSFRMMGGLAEDVSSSKIENGSLAVCFSKSGYYTGTLTYTSGNVSYDLPIYFTISDEESQIDTPDQLKVWLLADSTTVYPEGETGVSIATAVLAESLNSYYAGTTPSYVFDKGIEWSITVGASNALSLTIQPHTINTADIWLDAIAGIGDVQYTVSCVVDGKTYTGEGTLHIASDNEDRPDVTLKKTKYQVTQGIPTLISRIVYQRSNGSVLQSAGEWDVGSALAAIGYSYETTDDDWKVTFYKQGEYSTNVTTYVGNLRYNLPLTIKVVGKGEPEQLRTVKLPAALTVIEEEAFSELTIQMIDMRGTKISSISCNAFKNCTDLLDVFIPDSVTSIDANAFYGCINLTIHCNAGSVADTFASDHGFNVSYDMN